MAEHDALLSSAIVRDVNRIAVQAGGSILTQDATPSPYSSPLAVSSTILALTVPPNAIELILNPTATLRISEDSTMTHYDLVYGSTKEAIPCAKMDTIYIKRDAVDLTLNFRFTLI